MPGTMQADGSSPLNGNSNSGRCPSGASPPLQAFSELSVASIRSAVSPAPYPWLQELTSEERGLCLIQLLMACANAVSGGHMEQTNACLEQIALLASPAGDPMQRVAAYFMEGLATRVIKAWPGLHRALTAAHLLPSAAADLAAARRVFFDLFPYLKFAFGTIDLAILEAMEGERVVHVIDLDASEPAQWIPLLQHLNAREGGPPHLKITGVNERKEILDQTAVKLTEEAERLDIPFQFIPVVAKLDALAEDALRVKTGEAVAVSAVLQLHSLLAADGDAKSPPHVPARRGGSPQISNSSSGSSPNRFAPGATSRGPAKRPREADEDLIRTMFSGADRTLGEILEKERSDSSSSGGAPPRPPPHHHHHHHGFNLGRACNGISPSEIEAAISRRSSSSSSGVESSSSPSPPELAQPSSVDRFLRMLRSLSPKVMVVVEQESNHNGAALIDRFVEALHYYGTVFDSLESTLPRQCVERAALEKHLFGRQIQNIVACEGSERVERHEKLERWSRMLDRAGFAPLPLGYPTVMQAKRLVHSYSCDAYRVVEDKGSLTICWQERPLYSVSAWQS